MTQVFKAEVVSDVGAGHGDGPLWHPIDRRLDWVDIGAGHLHRFDPATGATETIMVGSPVGAFAPRTAGGFVLAIEEGFALLDPASDDPKLVAPVDHGAGPPTRMNDGKCDPRGCFWAGSMAYDCTPGHGALYRLDPSLLVTRAIGSVTLSNGLDWGDDGRTFFYVDTLAGGSFWDVLAGQARPGVDAFDADLATGSLARRRRLFDVPVEQDPVRGITVPDGMTLDADAFLWVAVLGSGQVRRYSPSGEVEAVVELPVACPTSVAFGGDDLEELYITTMTPHGAPGPDPRKPTLMWDRKPFEGALFRCRPGARGRPPQFFAG